MSRQAYFWLATRAGGESPVFFHALGLLIFLSALLAFFSIVRRLVGNASALFAVALVALHYSADVPLRWASGSQDLLAILFALIAIRAAMGGHRNWAAVALALALLSKEVVAGTAILAIVAGRQSGERWSEATRRSWALIATTAAWACWRVLMPHHAPGAELPGPAQALPGLLAAVGHLAQVAVAAEFRMTGSPIGHWRLAGFLPALVVVIVFWLVTRSSASQEPAHAPGDSTRSRLATALALWWIVLGTVPMVGVANIWSAYFYLWAMFGAGLLAASLTVHASPSLRVALLAALVGLSAGARALDEFEVSAAPWTWQSHVNRHYVDRSVEQVQSFVWQMKRARPALPRHSTVFFANVPPSSGWQTADGPVIRWAYQDSTLHSYFLTQFSRERARGEIFFFAVEGDSLVDHSNDPDLLPTLAFSMLLSERPGAAVDALDLALTKRAVSAQLAYWRGLAKWGSGDTAAAKADLRLAGMAARRAIGSTAGARLTAAWTDTLARLHALANARDSAALDPNLHARLAALNLQLGRIQEGAIESYAFRILSPDDPDAWRK